MQRLLKGATVLGVSLVITIAGIEGIANEAIHNVVINTDHLSIDNWNKFSFKHQVSSVFKLPTYYEVAGICKTLINKIFQKSITDGKSYIININQKDKYGGISSYSISIFPKEGQMIINIDGYGANINDLNRFLDHIYYSPFLLYEEYKPLKGLTRIPIFLRKYVDQTELKKSLEPQYINPDGTVNFDNLPVKAMSLDTTTISEMNDRSDVTSNSEFVNHVTNDLFISFYDSQNNELFRVRDQDLLLDDAEELEDLISPASITIEQ